jgi:hypothetical protein
MVCLCFIAWTVDGERVINSKKLDKTCMKNLRWLIIICFVGINSAIVAQKEFKEWAPMGANWLYWKPTFSGENFCVRIAHDRDTTIFNHKYKVFDVYQLFVKPSFEVREEIKLGSNYIGLVGDTVFYYCKNQNKEQYYVDRDIVGEKIYLFRCCNPTDTVWKKLDTVYYGKIGGITDGVKFKFRVYSSNVSYGNGSTKDTMTEFLPFKHGTFITHYGDNWTFNKALIYSPPASCQCSINISFPVVYPEKFSCYYDPNFGSFDFYGGQCWLRNAYMSIVNPTKNTFSISPNPAGNELMVDIEDKRDLDYFIYDINGRLILSDKFKQRFLIDISKLKTGNYHISIQNQSDVIGVQKFIKN